MTRYIVCLLTLTLLAIIACAPSGRLTQDLASQTAATAMPMQTQPSSTAVANATPQRMATPTVVPTVAPNPLNVQIKVDTRINASAVISTTGGTLSVRSADGTKFTLTFLKGSLLKDTQVTLTPLTGIDGLPFSGGLVGGVQMAPEGLRLLQPATLTIESPRTVAAKGFETVAFGYHQNGEGMYLNPSETQGNVLTLEVWHFSGAVAAQGTRTEIQTQQQQHVPDNPEDALAQRVAEYLRQQREAQLRGEKPDPDFGKKMTEFFREYYDRFIAPQLPIVLQDCQAGVAILSKATSWGHNVAILGLYDDFGAEIALILETTTQATVNCYNKEYEQCKIDHDPKHRAAMWGHLRLAALLGSLDRLDESKVWKCAPTYRVDTLVGVSTKVPLTGVVCNVEKPFTLKVAGVNAAGGEYVGEIVFTPTGESGGSWKHTATSCIPGVGCGAESGGSTYQLEGVADGKPVLKMNATTASSVFKGGSGAWNWPAWQIELHPTTENCSTE